jgi:hypothetical protein
MNASALKRSSIKPFIERSSFISAACSRCVDEGSASDGTGSGSRSSRAAGTVIGIAVATLGCRDGSDGAGTASACGIGIAAERDGIAAAGCCANAGDAIGCAALGALARGAAAGARSS